MLHNSDDVTSSVAEPEPVGAGTFFGRSRSRCKDVKAKTCYLLLFSLFLYEEEPELEPVKKKYLEPEPVKSGPAPQHWLLTVAGSTEKKQ